MRLLFSTQSMCSKCCSCRHCCKVKSHYDEKMTWIHQLFPRIYWREHFLDTTILMQKSWSLWNYTYISPFTSVSGSLFTSLDRWQAQLAKNWHAVHKAADAEAHGCCLGVVYNYFPCLGWFKWFASQKILIKGLNLLVEIRLPCWLLFVGQAESFSWVDFAGRM